MYVFFASVIKESTMEAIYIQVVQPAGRPSVLLRLTLIMRDAIALCNILNPSTAEA